MKPTTIFVTYNPNSKLEETLAARLHTIGAVSGFTMYLPDRFDSNSQLSDETKSRISRSDYLVIFSTKALSNVVKQEIDYAYKHFHDKSKILVIYDKEKGKNLKGGDSDLFVPFFLDKFDNKQEKLLETIVTTIAHKEKSIISSNDPAKIEKKKKQDTETNALVAILSIGLGLLVLGAIFDRD